MSDLPGFDDEDDTVYPTSPARVFMLRVLALGLAFILLLFLVIALAF